MDPVKLSPALIRGVPDDGGNGCLLQNVMGAFFGMSASCKGITSGAETATNVPYDSSTKHEEPYDSHKNPVHRWHPSLGSSYSRLKSESQQEARPLRYSRRNGGVVDTVVVVLQQPVL